MVGVGVGIVGLVVEGGICGDDTIDVEDEQLGTVGTVGEVDEEEEEEEEEDGHC